MDESHEHAVYSVHLRTEHRRLDGAVESIKRAWPESTDAAQSPASNKPTIDALVNLRAELARHFHDEESGGCLEEAVCRCPSLGDEANRIEGEHGPLLAELDVMISQLQSAREPLKTARELRGKFDAFSQALHAHEQAENALLENAFGIPID